MELKLASGLQDGTCVIPWPFRGQSDVMSYDMYHTHVTNIYISNLNSIVFISGYITGM